MEQFSELLVAGIMLLFFAVNGFWSKKFKIPAVLIYITAGMLVSSFIFGYVDLHFVAEIGIVLLFFLLGLEFPLQRTGNILLKIWPAGLIDFFLNCVLVMITALVFKMDIFSSLLLGSVLYASSSSITAKLLDEQKRLANPETEFILALLIFEDLIAPIIVSLLVGFNQGQDFSATLMLNVLGRIILLCAGGVFLAYYGFRRLRSTLSAHMDEDYMPLFAVGLSLTYAGIAVLFGLSEVLGAFLAGVMLAETGKSIEIERLCLPLRDLTLPFFFFWFGTTIEWQPEFLNYRLLIALIIWSIIGKIITGIVGGRIYGLSKKVAFRAGCSIIQRGEFSAIIASFAPLNIRIISGIYILLSAVVGVLFFQKAPQMAKWLNKKQ